MEDALLNYLKIILGNHVERDIVEYIYSMKHEDDLEEFMENILDKRTQNHMIAYEQIRKILFDKEQRNTPNGKANLKKKETPTKINGKHKAKKKFSDINSFQPMHEIGQRKMCDCEGQEHQFMTNCLNCGRIYCYEEGSGPCFFCNEVIAVMDGASFPGKRKLEKDRKNNGNKENKVFDDDNDYFKSNFSKNLLKKDQEKMVVALDLATRKVIESTEEDVRIKENIREEIKKHLKNAQKIYKNLQKQSYAETTFGNNNELVDLLIQLRDKKPVGCEDLSLEDNVPHFLDYGKFYDEEAVTNTDHGLCLSMHQPYASLLVAGVKKHEGRTWKTNHRGRLWIAATAKEPDEDEISALEIFYRRYYNDNSLIFPKSYPTSCLLGCVFIEDCLDQEIYRQRFINGESNSPYVLICSNPIILPIFYPIIGKHKIYTLDKDLHNCAKLALQHAICGFD